MKKIFVTMPLLALSAIAQPGQPAAANPLSTWLRGAYMGNRNNIVRTAEKMPEENYAFKPVPEVRSFGQLIGHITFSQQTLCAMVKGVPGPVAAAEKTAKADLIAAVAVAGGGGVVRGILIINGPSAAPQKRMAQACGETVGVIRAPGILKHQFHFIVWQFICPQTDAGEFGEAVTGTEIQREFGEQRLVDIRPKTGGNGV